MTLYRGGRVAVDAELMEEGCREDGSGRDEGSKEAARRDERVRLVGGMSALALTAENCIHYASASEARQKREE
jgi:hypothetical protein